MDAVRTAVNSRRPVIQPVVVEDNVVIGSISVLHAARLTGVDKYVEESIHEQL
jgi:hypothetical protein